MNAGSSTLVWEEDLLPGFQMICDTNFNIIWVKNPRGNFVSYHCADGISISDIQQVKNSILKTCTPPAKNLPKERFSMFNYRSVTRRLAVVY